MPRYFTQPLAQRIHEPILLPLAPLRVLAKTCIHDLIDFDVVDQRDRKREERIVLELLDALLHKWFIDPEGLRLEEFITANVEHRFKANAIILELQDSFQRLICNSIGTLMPSICYRYEIEAWHDTLSIVPTLPTLEDYEHRIQALCSDGSWTPSRYRTGR